MQNFRAYEKWQRKTSLLVYNTNSNANVEPVNNEFGVWKEKDDQNMNVNTHKNVKCKIWNHECMHMGNLNERIKVNLYI